MAIPDDFRSPVHWLIGLLFMTLGWFGRREVRRIDRALDASASTRDVNSARLAKLEADHVTRADFDELRSSMVATVTDGFQRVEDTLAEQNERTVKHRETVAEKLADIQQDVAVLKEGQRIRERQEELRTGVGK